MLKPLWISDAVNNAGGITLPATTPQMLTQATWGFVATAFAATSDRKFLADFSDTSGFTYFARISSDNSTPDNLMVEIGRITTDVLFATSDSPLGSVRLFQPRVFVVTFDITATPVVHIYHGPVTGPLVESTYTTTDNGSGGIDTGTPVAPKLWQIAGAGNNRAWRGLGYTAAIARQVLPFNDLIPFAVLGYRADGGFWLCGEDGTELIFDRSELGNHGTVIANSVPHPLVTPSPFQQRFFLYTPYKQLPPDESIWQLGALTTPALEDLLAAVDDPAGTPSTKKLALSDFAPLTVSNVVVQVKTVGSGTYTPTAGMKKVLGIAVGSGGGGGGGINTDSAGGGGGGGGTVIRLMTAADIGASKAYVVGAGGAAASNGNATTLDAAGALMNAGGGALGAAGATFSAIGANQATGGAGGTATNGDLNIPGEPGDRGLPFDGTTGIGGAGGGSLLGFGAAPGGSNVAGSTGGAYGGGGSGGHASGTANRDGGAGADGILYLIEFLG